MLLFLNFHINVHYLLLLGVGSLPKAVSLDDARPLFQSTKITGIVGIIAEQIAALCASATHRWPCQTKGPNVFTNLEILM